MYLNISAFFNSFHLNIFVPKNKSLVEKSEKIRSHNEIVK